MLLSAFQLIPKDNDNVYWNPVVAVILLMGGIYLAGGFFVPYLPAKVRGPLGFSAREELANIP